MGGGGGGGGGGEGRHRGRHLGRHWGRERVEGGENADSYAKFRAHPDQSPPHHNPNLHPAQESVRMEAKNGHRNSAGRAIAQKGRCGPPTVSWRGFGAEDEPPCEAHMWGANVAQRTGARGAG